MNSMNLASKKSKKSVEKFDADVRFLRLFFKLNVSKSLKPTIDEELRDLISEFGG